MFSHNKVRTYGRVPILPEDDEVRRTLSQTQERSSPLFSVFDFLSRGPAQIAPIPPSRVLDGLLLCELDTNNEFTWVIKCIDPKNEGQYKIPYKAYWFVELENRDIYVMSSRFCADASDVKRQVNSSSPISCSGRVEFDFDENLKPMISDLRMESEESHRSSVLSDAFLKNSSEARISP